MPLHGKIVVVKRSGGDGTEFPLTATCLFGRKPDCDIRIQLPQVSKEHCRIDLNENKEVILTNLSSVNPTRVNGEILQQSERLKHGDVITIIDRSFRFEYPPAPTPKKRSSVGGKTETFKVLQDQQVGDTVSTETGEKRISEVPKDPHLKDGANHDNIQRSLEKTMEMSEEDDSGLQSKTTSPFNDLYQMIKQSLDVKTPRKCSVSLLQTPASRFCTPKPGSVKNNVISTEDKSTPKKNEVSGADEIKGEAENLSNVTPKSVKKQRKSFQLPSTEMSRPKIEEDESAASSEAVSPQKRNRSTPQRFSVAEVIEQISETPKSPMRRRSKETTPAKPAVTSPNQRKASPRIAEMAAKVKEESKKRKSAELAADLPTPQMKKKRVSFGGYLCPELFDKRLPPDSPLRKGATPRRSLCLSKPKQSLLRRASVIGLQQEFEQEHSSPAKMSTPSPKKTSAKNASPQTPKPGKKSPKSRSPSPKAATPATKSPKSRSPSPKTATPARSPSRSKEETPKATPGAQTPSVQGRFSVSRISTPSPVAEDAVTDQVPFVTVTPKLPLRRKSIARKTPNVMKSAVKVMQRRSGISRASMKVKTVWANVVKFGPAKTQAAVPAKNTKTVNKKTTKKAVSKPQTPAKHLQGYVSTGHANSPATIVVGRAHQQRAVYPTGAAPKLVTNIAVLKKNMKMDEDLTGLSEMFKTPVNERKRKSAIGENSAMKTPVGALGTSVIEPSVLNTPEEPGEMMVSPLSVSSTVKDRRYNSEAVQRLLNGDQDSSFTGDISFVETHSDDSNEQQCTDQKTTSVATPKQKPELPECLTGVKRMMKTPRQKAEPVEDLRGRLLKTPKQKPEQRECLTGVKRIMKTPRQNAEPVEDLRGRLLKTPKQKPEQQECLTGVKRIMKTPRQKAEPIEDLRGKILKTPKQKPEQQECLTGMKRIFKTPQQETEPLENHKEKTEETHKALGTGDASGITEVVETPAGVQESEQVSEMTTPNVKSSPLVCLTGIKRIMKTPREKSAPVEDMVGVKRLMKTPREKSEPVEEKLGIKRLMKSPRPSGNAPVEDFEGLAELMEEPLTDPREQLEAVEVEDKTTLDGGVEVVKELDFAHEEQQDVTDDNPQVDLEKEAEGNEVDHSEEVQSQHDDESSDAMETISLSVVDENLPVKEAKVDSVDEKVSEEQREVETATGKVTEMETTSTEPDQEKKSVRGRRAKAVEEKQEVTEHSEDPVVPVPARGRRGKKTEATAPPAVRQTTRGRNAKTTEGMDAELEKSATVPAKPALKPKRGRNAKKACEDQDEMVQKVTTEIETVPELETPSADVDLKVSDSAAPLEKAVLKPKRGRKTKQPEESEPEQQDVPCTQSDNIPEADMEKVCSDQTKSRDAMETVTESLPEMETAAYKVTEVEAAIVEKKSVRGRKAKVVESKSADQKPEITEQSEDPVAPAPVRGRRGKKAEAAAPPAVKQTTRGRCGKSQESTSDDQPEIGSEKAMQTTPVTEMSTEAVSDQISPINTPQEENEPAPPTEEPVVKPVRGRKTKQTPVEPPQPQLEKSETVSEDVTADAPSQAIPAVGKPRRGRKTKADAAEQNETTEDTVVAVETKQPSQPPVRGKRGRNAKQEDDKPENNGQTSSVEDTKSQEPVKKVRRTRKADEPREEAQNVEVVVSQEAEVPPVAEPVKMNEQATVAEKPRRGGRKTKQDTGSETLVESTEVKEVLAVSNTDKPKRGRRGKQGTEEVEVTAEVPDEKPDHELEIEEKNEPVAPAVKPSRARGVKTQAKSEVSKAVPAKRGRRGAASQPEEADAESTVPASESISVEAPKRGRRAAAKPTTNNTTVTSDQANPSEDLSSAVEEDTKTSKRSVKWKTDPEVFEIPKETPVKAVRGRKSKLGDQVDAESKTISKEANKPEEKDLSDKGVEAQPAKRARRGAKVADATTEEESVSKVPSVETETQPKRRGRSAKK